MSDIDWDTPERALRYDQNCENQFIKGKTLIEMMGIKTGDHVLDIGCGTGQQAVHVAGIVGPHGSLTGIDPSSHRIKLASQKFKEHTMNNVQFMIGKAEDLSGLANSSMDHAYFCSSFHWIDEKQVALTEVLRILKPGGSLGITTRDGNASHSIRDLLLPIFRTYHLPYPSDPHRGTSPISQHELTHLLVESGFNPIFIEPRSIQWRYQDHSGRHRISERMDNLLTHVPPEIREQVRAEICDALAKNHTRFRPGSRNMTLFAIATKSGDKTGLLPNGFSR